MIESYGQRLAALVGSVAATPPDPSREKIVHRPATRVNALEEVDKNAQTGPRPTFRVTYLERAAAFWPEEPDAPVTDLPLEPQAQPERGAAGSLSGEWQDANPTVDVRR